MNTFLKNKLFLFLTSIIIFSSLNASDTNTNYASMWLEKNHHQNLNSRTVPLYDRTAYEFNYQNEWRLIDIEQKTFYLNLDNNSIAGFEEITEDPFLVLRTKTSGKNSEMDLALSLENFAYFSGLNKIQKNRRSTKCHGCSRDRLGISNIATDEGNFSSSKKVFIVNQKTVFDHESPFFKIDADPIGCDKIWWQISSNPEFDSIIPNFEAAENYTKTIYLDPLTNTFFNSHQPYYCRIKASYEGEWTDWSPAYSFYVKKPAQPTDVSFHQIDKNQFEISWTGSADSETQYLVFASNASDFIPSIYSEKQINAIENGKITAYESNNNLLTIVKTPSLMISNQHAYYRVVAERKGEYSVPSALAYFYDEEAKPTRTTIQLVSEDETRLSRLVQRVSIPPTSCEISDNFSQGYVRHPSISEDVWNQVAPYFLPHDHPMRPKLDRIFKSPKITHDLKTLKKAKFKEPKHRGFSPVTVLRHPKLKGYVIKLYTDDKVSVTDWQIMLYRVKGAQIIQGWIESHNCQNIFKVPKKWIYPLPHKPSEPLEPFKKHFVLIAEDMKIVSDAQNRKSWKYKLTPEVLDSVYSIIQELGLADSTQTFNIPFCKDGKIAFIDTEIIFRWPVPYENLSKKLHPNMRDHLQSLIDHDF